MTRWLILVAAVLLLAGCGKSSGSSSPAPTPPTPPTTPRQGEVLFGFFGCQSRREMEEQAGWCNLVYLADWGEWGTPSGRQMIADRIVQQLGDARTLGFRRAIVCVGFLCFDPNHRSYLGTTEVQRFRQRISDAGLLELVVGVSVLDEPDLVPVPDEVMTMAYRDVKAAWGPSVKLAAIYGDHGYPGGAEVDWIATDRYDLQDGVLTRLPALQGTQQHLLVCGGASPYRNAPEPFYDFAQAHPEVVGILCFIYGPYTGVRGESEQGIADNGMLERFKAVGRQVIAAGRA